MNQELKNKITHQKNSIRLQMAVIVDKIQIILLTSNNREELIPLQDEYQRLKYDMDCFNVGNYDKVRYHLL